MLNVEEIASLLETGGNQGLTVVPAPHIPTLLARGATSVDLRLGRWFRSFKQTRVANVSLAPPESDSSGAPGRERVSRSRQHFVPFGETFVLHPGRFVLGATLEWLRLPKSLSGYVTGMSSLGRHGLIIETAAGIHPGFSGCLTLELANIGEVPLEISPGMQICQIFLHRVREPEHLSAGRFSGARKPVLQAPKPDQTFQRLNARRPATSTT